MENLQEIAAYCAAYIEDYELRVQLALGVMERMRCSLRAADCSLYDDIYDLACEWAVEHGIGDEFEDDDIEDILFAAV